jgi:hypothetical protein
MSESPAGGPSIPGRQLFFSAGGRTVVAEILEPAFLDSVRRLYPEYQVAQPRRLNADVADVSFSKGPNGYAVTSPDSPDVICGNQMDAIVALEFALTRKLAASCDRSVHLHASGAVVGGGAILALGASGAGKSSVALSLLMHGYPTLGDDMVLLGPTGSVAPFKRLLKVSREMLGELGIDPGTTVHWDADWPEAWLDPGNAAGWAEEAPVAVLALVQYRPHAPLSISPVPPAEGLNALVHSVMVTGKSAAEGFDRLVRVAQSAKMYRLEFPSAIAAADTLCSLSA